jgi:glutamate decarboxylase
MLGGLALKRRWQLARRAAGKDASRPNLIMGENVQVCWEKFANYWDVEARMVPVEGDVFHLRADAVAERCDENTVGVVAVLGSTYDGSFEPVAEISAVLDILAADGGPDVPVHVDGASGGLIAPFLDPDLAWDFRLRRVASINTSGHKYGLVFPGVGWVVWRDAEALPEELIFHVSYLGGSMPTFALNFSRSGSQVVGQYYAFLRLGFEGFRRVQQACRDTATWLASRIGQMAAFDLVTDGSELPVFAFRRPDGAVEEDGFTVFDVSDELRQRGWQVPAYAMPPNREDLAVLRVVVRNGFGRDLAGLFLADLERSVKELREHPPAPRPARKAFGH